MFGPVLVVVSNPRRPQDSQFLLSIHWFDARVRLTTCFDPPCGAVYPGPVVTDDVAGVIGADAGRAMTSVETIYSILLKPSKIGVCALLFVISNMMYIEHTSDPQKYQRHQVRQSLLYFLCLAQHSFNGAGVFNSH
jgi:hypothetical protein